MKLAVTLASICLSTALVAQEPAERSHHHGKRPAVKRAVKTQVRGEVKDRLDRNDDGRVGPVERRGHGHEVSGERIQEAWQRFNERHPDAAEHIRAKADKNGDGTIDADERRNAMRYLHENRGELKQKFKESERFDHLDKNDDGHLGPRERRHAREHGQDRAQDTVRGAVKERLDRNDDGRVGPRERAHGRHQARQHARSAAKDRLDRNDDGRVGPRERNTARRAGVKTKAKVKAHGKRQTRRSAHPPK